MRFAAIGLDHRHIFHMVAGLIAAGATCVGFDPATSDERVLAGFRERFPGLPECGRAALIDDPAIDMIVCAAIPARPRRHRDRRDARPARTSWSTSRA